jgi:hypothetical protein
MRFPGSLLVPPALQAPHQDGSPAVPDSRPRGLPRPHDEGYAIFEQHASSPPSSGQAGRPRIVLLRIRPRTMPAMIRRRPAATSDLKDNRAPGGPRTAIRRLPTRPPRRPRRALNQAIATTQLPASTAIPSPMIRPGTAREL